MLPQRILAVKEFKVLWIVKVERATLRAVRRRRLLCLQSNLAFLLGPWPANPYDATADGVQLIVAGDDLDDLSALQAETAPEPEPVGRAVHNQAGNPLGMGTEVDNNAGSLLYDDPLGSATFVRRKGGHGFILDADFPHVNHIE
jgi:hypothetical protein